MKITFQIEGAAELERNLATLPDRVQKGVVRTAVRNAQRPVLAACQAGARSLPRAERKLFALGEEDVRMSELMARSLAILVPHRQQSGSYALQVQFKRDVQQFIHVSKAGTRTYIPAAIEYGHGANPEQAARPFMRPAAAGAVGECQRVLAREMGSGILREAIKGRVG